MYKTCVQHDDLASESSSIAKSLQCVLTRSDVFIAPRNLQFLLVFDQTLCQNVTKVLNLTGCILFSVSFRFIIIFEPVRYRNAKQCICLEFAQQNQKSKSNLHYTRRITPKRVTSCGAHLRGSAPGLHSSEETSQRWRVVGDTM